MSKPNLAARTVCVFCGAGGKMSSSHKQNAFTLGQQLAHHGFGLLTGGANVGMMKEVVDGHASITTNLTRYGVLPNIFKDFDIAHPLILENNFIWSNDVHHRLKTFYEICDDIVVLPGGFGTLHELMDCLVHSQYGIIKKRIFLLNINNYWDAVISQFKMMVAENAVEQKHLDHLIVVNDISAALDSLNTAAEMELQQGIEAQRWKE